jgi:hypothetical protein
MRDVNTFGKQNPERSRAAAAQDATNLPADAVLELVDVAYPTDSNHTHHGSR